MVEKTLSDLLKMAKGHRSLNAYARDAGISSGNLSRIMNGQKASPEILEKLAAKAQNGVTYEQLMVASDYVDPTRFDNTDSTTVFSEFFAPIKLVKVPVFHRIPAEGNIEKIENVVAWKNVPEEDVIDGEYYFLKVPSDTMISSRIYDGDLALVRRQCCASENAVVVIRYSGKPGALHRIKEIGESVWIYSDNPKYAPIMVNKNECEFLGVVVKIEFWPSAR